MSCLCYRHYCTKCGWDLTPYPSTLGDIPEAYRLKEQSKLNWAKQYYQNVQQSLHQLKEDNRLKHEELSQALEQQKKDYQAQLSSPQQELAQLQQQICLQQEELNQAKRRKT